MIVEEIITVERAECVQNGAMTDKAILDRLNHVAGVHAYQVGQGADDIPRTHIAWMVMNWKVVTIRRPMAEEQLRVITWSRGFDRLQAYRDYEIHTMDGECLVKAASIWIAVDPEKGMVLRLTEEIMGAYRQETGREAFPGFAFPKYRKLEAEVLRSGMFRVRPEMVDYNGHMHNSDYLSLLSVVLERDESAPEWDEAGPTVGADGEKTCFDDVEITFRKEIPPGAEVLVELCEADDRRLIVAREPETRTMHAVISIGGTGRHV